MLSHLRFHKRDRSNPASPIPPDNTHNPWGDLHPARLVPDDGVPAPDVRPRSSHQSIPSSSHTQAVPTQQQQQQQPPLPPSTQSQALKQQAPTLPPIPRVASDASDLRMEFTSLNITQRDESKEESKKTPLPSPYNESSGFIGGLALRNLQREQEASLRAAQHTNIGSPGYGSSLSPAAPPDRPVPSSQPVKAASSFLSPTEMYKPSATGKRPPGSRMTSEPAGLPSQSAMAEQPRGKKSLPFLKNPVSTLLLRRKTSQNVPNLSIQSRQPATYDPSIRGTRVHDFTTPRLKKAPVSDANSPRPADAVVEADALGISTSTLASLQEERPSAPSSSTSPPDPSPPVNSSTIPQHPVSEILPTHQAPREQQDTVPTSITTEIGTKVRMSSRRKRGSGAPTLSPLSRNASDRAFSAIPKHMKSTSSRISNFSFDLTGSADQEKLLEERHWQKQQGKLVDEEDQLQQDSRYNEFDEYDFDEDKMYEDMNNVDYEDDGGFGYDDGDFGEGLGGMSLGDYEQDELDKGFHGGLGNQSLEDYEQEETGNGLEGGLGNQSLEGYEQDELGYDEGEDDPDNDQENFGGFNFQRSDPTSLVATPLDGDSMLTPRDAGGNIIGYASAGSTPTYPPPPNSAEKMQNDLVPMPLLSSSHPGLGIYSSQPNTPSKLQEMQLEENTPASELPRHLDPDDELCFRTDDFSGEGDGNAFDESLFDLDDTDQYGRPIPGAFAQALAQRNLGQIERENHESEETSRLSAHTDVTQSTAHTSLSAELKQRLSEMETIGKAPPVTDEPLQRPEPTAAEKEQLAAYQAALAAAACQAAASGKFDRDSPPSPDDLVRKPSVAASSIYSTEGNGVYGGYYDSIEDYEADDDTFAGLDDYELDDDAIIAEANASALANDSDGFYGQEFGFYAAPSQQAHLLQQQRSSKSLTEQNLYQYSHGGFFGPSNGLDRSMSGHAVSREPNLTPITERSEYSNRNSIMSLGIPPAIGSAPIQSPGLAQLAMMADDDDMSLSALLKLRNKAWGGSQASLSSREGSPHERNGATSPWGQEPSAYQSMMSPPGRKNSAFSNWSESSAGPGSNSGSPTITLSAPILPNNLTIPPLLIPSTNNQAISPSMGTGSFASPQQPSSACPPVFEDDETDEALTTASVSNSSSMYISSSEPMGPPPPRRPSSQQALPIKSHRHKNSADSISYTKEEESGETRWVVERRRTAESGEMEVLAREIIHGGRI